MQNAHQSRSFLLREPTLEAYMAEIMKIPMVSAGAERVLIAEAKAGNRASLNTLVSSHLRFVAAVSWKYRNRGLPLTDLMNEGNLALYRAAEHFEIGNRIRFISYAVWWIRQGMLEAIARQAGAITFPPDRMHKAIRYRRIENVLTQRLGRSPSLDELASAAGGSRLTAASIRAVIEGMHSTRVIGTPMDGLLDRIESKGDGSGAESIADLYLIRKALKSCLESLNTKEKLILSLRYGLGRGMPLSLAEVGSIVGLTRERVRQLQERAVASLRSSFRGSGF